MTDKLPIENITDSEFNKLNLESNHVSNGTLYKLIGLYGVGDNPSVIDRV